MNNCTGIIAAMDAELHELISSIDSMSIEKVLGREIYRGYLEGQPVAITFCGWGKVNASSASTMLACHSKVTRILMTGLAGGLAPQIRVGDFVIGDSFVQHDMDARPLFPRYTIPCEDFSLMEAKSEFNHLINEAVKKMIQINQSLKLENAQIWNGLMVSGDQFLATDEGRIKILKFLPKALCVDMESAAVAQVCRLANLSFGVVRIISDLADESSPVNFKTFSEASIARVCAETVRFILHEM